MTALWSASPRDATTWCAQIGLPIAIDCVCAPPMEFTSRPSSRYRSCASDGLVFSHRVAERTPRPIVPCVRVSRARPAVTFEGLLIASVLYSLPFAVQPFAAEFASIDRRLLEASWSLGVSRLGTFRRIVLPLSVRGLVTGIVLSFAHTLGEFGVVLMVGGNLPGVTRTVSISIYDACNPRLRVGVSHVAAAARHLVSHPRRHYSLRRTYGCDRSTEAGS